jgi:hypothetical protein
MSRDHSSCRRSSALLPQPAKIENLKNRYASTLKPENADAVDGILLHL